MDNEFERTMNDAANAAKEAFSKRNGKKTRRFSDVRIAPGTKGACKIERLFKRGVKRRPE